MAAFGWGTDHPLEEWLFAEGHRFDFYQAVRLVEILFPRRVSLGEGPEPGEEGLVFKSRVGTDFPASEIFNINPPERPDGQAEMTVNFMGLAGALGPLPPPYTELILERVWHKDTAFRDFLDIFNHRLVSLMYRVRKNNRIGFEIKPPHETPFATYLFSLIGLGNPGLKARMRVADRSLLFYTGILAQKPRSMAGLEALLHDYFHIKVRSRQFFGRWHTLEDELTTAIGNGGRNQRLGMGAVLGDKVWDQEGMFELLLGPLTYEEFLDLLPIGKGFVPLCQLTRFYVGEGLDFGLRLTLRADHVPYSRLSAQRGPRLGWTSWLKTKDFTADDSQVRLRSHL